MTEREEFLHIMDTPEYSWQLCQLSMDRLYHKIPEEEKKEIIRRAVCRGRKLADIWLEEEPGGDLKAWCQKHAVEIVENSKSQSLPYVVFALFTGGRKSKIEIYTESLTRAGNKLAGIIPGKEIYRAVLAHECFHAMEMLHPENTEEYHLSYRTAGFRQRAGIRQMSELAAMAFAGKVCSLSWNTGILNVALLASYDSGYVEKYRDYLIRIK